MTAAPPKPRRAVEIEALLQWAFRDELPKQYTSSAEGIWDVIALGTATDDGRGRGAAQRYPHFGLPHPDAEVIESAVAKLPDLAADRIDPDWLMGDLIALYRARDVLMVRSLRTVPLVIMHAKMGTRPDWYPDPPKPRVLPAERGPGIQIRGGRCKGRNIYTYGSHCPLRWEPSALDIAEGRADYAAWWMGLEALVPMLQNLSDHVALPPAAPADPWRNREALRPVIQPAKVAVLKPLPLKPARKWAGPRFSRRKGGAVRVIPVGEVG